MRVTEEYSVEQDKTEHGCLRICRHQSYRLASTHRIKFEKRGLKFILLQVFDNFCFLQDKIKMFRVGVVHFQLPSDPDDLIERQLGPLFSEVDLNH